MTIDHSASTEALRQLVSACDSWLRHDALVRLFDEFGIDVRPALSADTLLQTADALVRYSDIWDYRRRAREASGPGSRMEILSTDLSANLHELILGSAAQLGLIGVTSSSLSDPAIILVLGGARYSNQLRTRHALDLAEQSATFQEIACLASNRALADDEKRALKFTVDLQLSEYDLMEQVVESELSRREYAISSDQITRSENQEWVERLWNITTPSGVPKSVKVLSAPSRDPGRSLANTADTILFLLERRRDESPPLSYLAVTSEIYVTYQQLEVYRAACLGTLSKLDTVGFPMEWAPIEHGLVQPENYLQEIRSTLQSIQRLLSASGN